MLAEKHTVVNHRGISKIRYKVIERHTFSSTKEIISNTYKGIMYEDSDIHEIQ